jgi:hypothetical protein
MSLANQQAGRRGLLLLRERASQRTTLLLGARAHCISVDPSAAQQGGCISVRGRPAEQHDELAVFRASTCDGRPATKLAMRSVQAGMRVRAAPAGKIAAGKRRSSARSATRLIDRPSIRAKAVVDAELHRGNGLLDVNPRHNFGDTKNRSG